MDHRRGKRLLLAGLVLFGLSPAISACAKPSAKRSQKSDVHVLNQIVVTGSGVDTNAKIQALKLKNIFRSESSEKVIAPKALQHLGPVAGSAQALSIAPGVEIAGYGNTGSTKNSISINGIKQGWGGAAGGGVDDGSVSVTFDGIPMVDPATGLWESPEVPQLFLIRAIKLTYGPGNPLDRWYNNVGGQIAFIPVQPSAHAGAKVRLSYGSYQAHNLALVLQSGSHNGWAAVLAGGFGDSNSYRDSIGGFKNPSSNYAWFLKVRKVFASGDLSFGAYDAQGSGYRPNYVPVNPIAGVTVNGYNAAGQVIPGALYSQKTTGFYSALPYDVWHKKDYNRTVIYYIKVNTLVAPGIVFHNRTWYRHASRLHNHYYNYVQNANNLYEHNNPHNNMYGDKAWLTFYEPFNKVSVGGWFLHDRYNTRNAFYNPNAPYNGSESVPNAHYRSDYFEPTYLTAFVQDNITPLPSLTLTPGVRWINYEINYYPGAAQDFPQSYALYPQNNQAQLPAATTHFENVEPSFAMRWSPMAHVSLFANWSVAYREPNNGGGGGPFQSVPAYALRLEKGTEYQAGAKLYWRHAGPLRHFLVSANYYHLLYSGQYIPITSQNGTYLATAQGSSRYEGVNLYAQDDPIQHLHLFANLNVETAKFDHYAVGGLSYDGRSVSQVPDHTFNLGASYRINAGGVSYEPRVWYQEIGRQHIFNNNLGAPSNQTMPAYGLLNLGVNVDVPFETSTLRNLRFDLSVLNVLDKKYNEYEYISSGGYFVSPSSQGALLAYPGAPRTVYLSVEAAF